MGSFEPVFLATTPLGGREGTKDFFEVFALLVLHSYMTLVLKTFLANFFECVAGECATKT